MKKRIRLTVLCCLLLCVILCIPVTAEEPAEESTVSEPPMPLLTYVTLTDGDNLLLQRFEVSVIDTDGDGVLTVWDALCRAHELQCPSKQEGIAAEQTETALQLTKLWGKTEGVFSCYRNNAPTDLLSPIEENDRIYASVAGADAVYTYFQTEHVAVSKDGSLKLTLNALVTDENGEIIPIPVADATVLINGEPSSFVTNENGEVTLKFDGAGYCVVSAYKQGADLLPPICAVAIKGEKAFPGDEATVLLWSGIALLSLCGILYLRRKRVGNVF